MVFIFRGVIIFLAKFILFIGFMFTAERSTMTFNEWLKEYFT